MLSCVGNHSNCWEAKLTTAIFLHAPPFKPNSITAENSKEFFFYNFTCFLKEVKGLDALWSRIINEDQ